MRFEHVAVVNDPKQIFLRFRYDTAHAPGRKEENVADDAYLRQTYAAADSDTVQVMRLLASEPAAS